MGNSGDGKRSPWPGALTHRPQGSEKVTAEVSAPVNGVEAKHVRNEASRREVVGDDRVYSTSISYSPVASFTTMHSPSSVAGAKCANLNGRGGDLPLIVADLAPSS